MTRPAARPRSPVIDGSLVVVAALLASFTIAFNAAAFDDASPIAFASVRMLVAGLAFGAMARARGEQAFVRPDWPMAAWAAALVLQNFTVYVALESIGLGLASTVLMLGPIGLSLVLSRRPIDAVWAGVALVGVVTLARPWQDEGGADATGLALCVVSAGCWALYIVAGRAARGRRGGLAGRGASGSLLGFVLAVPALVAVGGFPVHEPVPVVTVLASGVLGAAVPWAIDLSVLRRLSSRAFGVLQSLYPVASALAGLVVLGQTLAPLDLLGIGLAVAASAAIVVGADD